MTKSFVLHTSNYITLKYFCSAESLHASHCILEGASSVQVLSQRKPTTVTKKKLAQSFVKARLCPPFAFDRPLWSKLSLMSLLLPLFFRLSLCILGYVRIDSGVLSSVNSWLELGNSALLYEMPSNYKGKNFVSKIYCYCPQNTME